MKITLDKNGVVLTASIDESGLLIDYGWSMGITKDDAIKYVKDYNASPNYGFQIVSMGVVLTHKDAKLMLSPDEANTIINLISEHYQL